MRFKLQKKWEMHLSADGCGGRLWKQKIHRMLCKVVVLALFLVVGGNAYASAIKGTNCITYVGTGVEAGKGRYLEFSVYYYDDNGDDNVVRKATFTLDGKFAFKIWGFHQNDGKKVNGTEGYYCFVEGGNTTDFYVEARADVKPTTWTKCTNSNTITVINNKDYNAGGSSNSTTTTVYGTAFFSNDKDGDCHVSVRVFLPYSYTQKSSSLSWEYNINNCSYIDEFNEVTKERRVSNTITTDLKVTISTPAISADLNSSTSKWQMKYAYGANDVIDGNQIQGNSTVVNVKNKSDNLGNPVDNKKADYIITYGLPNATSGFPYLNTIKYTINYYPIPKKLNVTNNGNGILTATWNIDKTEDQSFNSAFRLRYKYQTPDKNGKVTYSDWVNKDVPYVGNNYSVDITIPDKERENGLRLYQFEVNRVKFDDTTSVTKSTDSITIQTNYVRPEEVFFDKETKNVYFKLTDGIKPDNVKYAISGQRVNDGFSITITGEPLDVKNTDAKEKGFAKYFPSQIEPCKPTVYSVQTQVGSKLIGEPAKTDTITWSPDRKGEILSFTASKGYFNNKVVLKWEVNPDKNDYTSFSLERYAVNDSAGSSRKVLYEPEYKSDNAFTYTDDLVLPGTFYRYKLFGRFKCDTTEVSDSPKDDIGYAQAFGSISGKVTFSGTDVAVENADILFESNGFSKNRSLDFGNQQEAGYLRFPTPYIKQSGSFTFQMWCKIRSDKPDGGHQLFYGATEKQQTEGGEYVEPDPQVDIYLDENRNIGFELFGDEAGGALLKDVEFPLGEYFHITGVVTRKMSSANDNIIYTLSVYLNGKYVGEISAENRNELTFNLGRVSDNELEWKIDGCIDELRMWDRALTADEIEKNFDRYIPSNSAGLRGYYRFDEPDGVGKNCFDISVVNQTEGNYNENHGICIGTVGRTDTDTPAAEQLALKAVTGKDGNYIADKILPYLQDGTLYTVTPRLGVHQFQKKNEQQTLSSTNFSADNVNFEDISKFTYNGTVVYQGGNFPVEGCSFLIDGAQQVDSDQKPILSDTEGHFSLTIPVGTHTIKIQKTGHAFAKDTIRRNFQDEELAYDVRFEDKTRIRIVGRVVGGTVEGTKPLGFGMSKNNVGPATIELLADKENYTFITGGKDTAVTHFDSKRNNPVNYNGAQISIQTNDATGEFYADVYPEKFRLMHIYTDTLTNRTDYLDNTSQQWDLTNKVTVTKEAQAYLMHTWTDTIIPNPKFPDMIQVTSHTDSIAYNDTLSYVHRENPIMTIVELDEKNNPKMLGDKKDIPYYGESQFVYTKPNEKTGETVDLVSLSPDKSKAVYTFTDIEDTTNSYPVYSQNKLYRYRISLRESYQNWKTKNIDNVPVQGAEIRVKNEMAQQTAEQRITLDSLGQYLYQSVVYKPNTATGLSSVEFSYPCLLDQCPDQKIDAIIIGGESTGTNFATQGPDKVFFVLRDPPGDNSYAYWETGSSLEYTQGYSINQDLNAGVSATVKLGLNQSAIMLNGIGVSVGLAIETETTDDSEAGLSAQESYNEEGSKVTTITTNQRIETSSDPAYVGPDADVFVGASTNILYGYSNMIQIGDGDAAGDFANTLFKTQNGQYFIGKNTGIAVGESFKTTFHYTQQMIRDMLIPEWHTLIGGLLKTATPPEASSLKTPYYHSTVPTGNENFGKPGYYTIVYPASWTDANKMAYTDSVGLFNKQIAGWENTLRLNERAKVNAVARDNFNYSFGGGVSIDYSVVKDTLNTSNTSVGGGFSQTAETTMGVEIAGTGVDITASEELNFMKMNNSGNSNDKSETVGFVLSTSGSDNKLSADIYDGVTLENRCATDPNTLMQVCGKVNTDSIAGGFIFVTRGGQTSCPYEGEYKTQYYQPGIVLNEATMRNEVPMLRVLSQATVSGVPADGKAVYQIQLINNSESKVDGWYNLSVQSASNPDGAVVRVDGQVLTEDGTPIFVPYGEKGVTKTVTIERGPQKYTYENINLVMASQCQYNNMDEEGGDIFSAVQLSATFLSGCSEVTMTDPLDYWVMNTENATSNALSIKVTGFDRNFENLGWVDVQWKESYSSIWNTLKRYYFSQKVMDGDNTISPENKVLYDGSGQIVYPWDMTSRADGNYEVRAITACVDPVTFAPFIYTTTPAKAGVKDMIRPEPFGRPEPKDGVLDINDEIMIQFNEPIAGGRIIDDNIKVTGILSAGQGPKYHPAAVHFDGASAVANTQNDITLTAPFTVEAWVRPNENYADGEDHVIFSHGDNFMIGIEDGSVYVKANGQKMYSDEIEFANPSPEWGHVAVSYNEKGIVFGYYAYGATTVSFSGNPGAYNQTGRIAIGNSVAGGEGIDADIHDVRVWTTNRSESETAGNMSSIYNGAETNLKHYWRMDEMEGTTAADLAGGLTAALTGATWTMPNPGKDLTLASGSNLNFSGANFGFSNMNDFTIELWFKGNNQKNATLFSAGNGAADSDMGGEQIVYDSSNKLSIFFDKDGKLSLSNNGQTFTMNPTNYTDDQWHHLAFTVNRLGNATMYIDGNSIWNTPASNIGGMTATNYYIGQRGWYKGNAAMNPDFQLDNPFAGQIDEIRIWNAALDAAHIKDQKNVRLKGNELGLTAYYPLESYGVQDGSPVINTSLANFAPGATDAATLTGAAALGNDYAPVKMEGPSINLGYRKVVNGDKILITLTDPRYRLEKSLVTISVDGVQDLNGNKQASAVIWTALINQSQLRWEENELTLEGKPNTTIQQTIQINNTGGEAKTFTIENLPTWLQVTPASGTIAAQASQTITIKAAPGVNVGKYEQTILLNGPKTIDGQPESSDQLTVSLNVKDEAPDWNVNPANYEHNSSVIATLLIDNFYSTDTDDKLAAFVGDECRGVANVTYEPTFGRYVVYLTIYSNDFTADNFVFRIWDAGASEIREAATTSAISWGDGYSFGSINAPVAFSTTDAKLRDLELPTGWTWLSLNTKTDDMSVNNTFGELTNKAEILKSQDAFSATNTGKWQGALTSVDNKQMYKVKMTQASVLHTAGTPVTPADETVTLRPNWNWIGYTPQGMLTVQQALAGLTPSEGDIVKDQTSFATYNKGNWTGSLTTMVPGRGYVYQSNATADKTFTYPYATETKSAPALRADAITNFQPVSSNTYSDNMSIIAVVKRGGDVLRNVEVGAFAGNECRGAQTDGDNGLVFLTVTGQTNDASLSFSVYESATGNVSAAAQTLPYSNDGVAGTIASPYVIQLEGTGVDDVLASNIAIYPNPVKSDLNIIRPWTLLDKVEVIDLSGRILFSEDNFSKSSLNVFDLTPGMYILKVTQNEQSVMLKFTKMQ